MIFSFMFKDEVPRIEQSFIDLVIQGFRSRLIRGPLILLGFIFLALLANLLNGGDGWEIFPRLIQPTGLKGIAKSFDPPVLVFLMITLLFAGFIWALYWYLRVRNPTHIKKQEAYEKWKAGKESKKSAQPVETEP